MKSSRAFVFSLDAFVAFSLALIIIYSLIFFSGIPYGYYSSFMQAHYLAKDALTSLSLAELPAEPGVSRLDYVVNHKSDPDEIKTWVGPLIPNQFGYRLDTGKAAADGSISWSTKYDTGDENFRDSNKNDLHKKTKSKLQASAQVIVFGFELAERSFPENPYGYITCQGEYTQCDPVTRPSGHKPESIEIVRLTVYT